MANAAPQIPPIPNYDLGTNDTIPNLIQLDSAASTLKPQSWELYVDRIAPELARQTGETVEEARHQLRTLFQPVPDQTMSTDALLRAMDWDDAADDPYSTHPSVVQSGVVSKNSAAPAQDSEQLLSNENGVPIYVDEKDLRKIA